jgi:hypothetical protein
MNSSDACHIIEGCPGVYVDAFQGRFLREKTKDPKAIFILSHYHGDHYQQLPRNFKYQGPAKIHCTPITASLLKNIHEISPSLVVSHDYGSTFEYQLPCLEPNTAHSMMKEKASSTNVTKITFYDAHHCPGACIILFELPNGNVNVHTGDMRYNPTLFKSFPRLLQAVSQNKIDCVYLDTTYSHPKHDFCPQEEAINTIAKQTEDLLLPNRIDNHRPGKTLVLLSCYSIGKEKVLWEVSKRCNQPVYVSEKKLRMLQCIMEELRKVNRREKTNDEFVSIHDSSMHYYTRELAGSDVHVIPMGMAGEMWPFFRPNFQKIASYVQNLDWGNDPVVGVESVNNTGSSPMVSSGTDPVSQPASTYNKVVAFIPTGWANASNWNKKNAISTKDIVINSRGGTPRTLHVEVRLIGYSEHSSFCELQSFLEYLRPRMVIPTVFSDEADSRRIVARFRNLVDQTKAQKAFLRSMIGKSDATSEYSKEIMSSQASTSQCNNDNGSGDHHHHHGEEEKLLEMNWRKDDQSLTDDDIVVITQVRSGASSDTSTGGHVKVLIEMGFSEGEARTCLVRCHNDLPTAIDALLGSCRKETATSQLPLGKEVRSSGPHPRKIDAPGESMDFMRKRKRSCEGSKVPQITDFFQAR